MEFHSLLKSINLHCFIGLAVRLLLMIFGIYQDTVSRVKYTDIDYFVFTDAAHYVTLGDSPYRRPTYRYTPILAWILTPNIYVHACCGKVLFVLCDIIVGYIIYHLVLLMQSKAARRGSTEYQDSVGLAVFCASLWLYNPLTAGVSSRGNAESLLSVLVLLVLYCLTSQRRTAHIAAFMLYGLTVHMKIYPIIYSLPLYLAYQKQHASKNSSVFSKIYVLLRPTWGRLALVVVSVSTFLILTGACYWLYGDEFLHETYLYHITRRDIRHNFSVYFYALYLTEGTAIAPILSLAAFVPQVVLILTASLRYHQDLPFTCFVNTFVFVTFNKVCTSQYFLWYLCFLPLIVPRLNISCCRAVALTLAWFAAQALWLAPAYYLEFEGVDTYVYIWLAGMLFFMVNVTILYNIVTNYTPKVFVLGRMDDAKIKSS